MKIELEKGEGLEKGERYIVVDGVRWGQTVVTHHGVHGTRYRFRQYGSGDLAAERPDADKEYRRGVYDVRSEKRKRVWVENKLVLDPNWRPVEELVLEKVRMLVDGGKLRDPDVVRVEVEAREERRRREQEGRDAREKREFEVRAEKALDRTRGLNLTEQVRIIVELMRWAQTK